MKYEKVTCKLCEGKGCTACQDNGYMYIADRPQARLERLINNKPNGTGARDGFNYGIGK